MFEKSREQGTPSLQKETPRRKKRGLAFTMFLLGISGILAIQFKDDISALIKHYTQPVVQTRAEAGPGPYTDKRLSDFAVEAYVAIATIRHPTTLDEHMDNVRGYLTDEGYESLKQAYRRARFVEPGRDVGVAIAATPRVTDAKRIDGVWRWVVEFPADISFSTAASSRVNRWDVTLVIQDMVRHDPAIAQVIAVPR